MRDLIEAAKSEIERGDLTNAVRTLERALWTCKANKDAEGLVEIQALLESLWSRLSGRRRRQCEYLIYAARQNIALYLRADLPRTPDGPSRWADREAPQPSSAGSGRTRDFLFGDARRPLSLALALVASLALFPLVWFLLLIALGLSFAETPDDGGERAQHVILVLAAIFTAIGVAAATLDWLGARRSYPQGQRGRLASREGLASAAGVLVATCAAITLSLRLWDAAPL